MQIVAILQRWLDVLASVLFACRETWRARRALIVSRSADGFIVRKAEPQRDAIVQPPRPNAETVIAAVPVGSEAPAHVLRSARNGFVVYELGPDDVAVRRLNIPAPAREFLPGIVRNQIERLSPWNFDQVAYGFDATPHAEDPANLDVRVSIASRRIIEAARNDVAAIGLTVDRIVTRRDEASGAGTVTLWSDGTREDAVRVRNRIAAGIAATVVISVALSAWAVTSAQSLREESDAVETRSKSVQRQITAARSPQALAALNPQQRLWHVRETSPAAVVLLEALSRTLPDAAYLTELRLENATVRMVGLAKDAPSLIAPLEQSGQLADVHFAAPTTRDADGVSFRFHIEARVEPKPAAADAKP
jgi:general secretion pathway protein L